MGIITVCIGKIKIHDYISLLTIPIAFMVNGDLKDIKTSNVNTFDLNNNILS